MADQLHEPDTINAQSSRPALKTALGPVRTSPPASLHQIWKRWIRPIGIAALLVMSFKSAILDWYDVRSGSMEPSISPGDRIGVNKFAYDLRVPFTLLRLKMWDDPSRGDVILALSPEDKRRLIKRVIGLPGDTVAMRDNHLYINGQAVGYHASSPFSHLEGFEVLTEELPGHEHPVMLHLTHHAELSTFQSVTVPEGHYMLLGDNRDLSGDSRVFGCVPRRFVLGRASRVIISLDHKKWWTPRWERFMNGLP